MYHLTFLAKIEWELFNFGDLSENLLDGTLLSHHLQVTEDGIQNLIQKHHLYSLNLWIFFKSRKLNKKSILKKFGLDLVKKGVTKWRWKKTSTGIKFVAILIYNGSLNANIPNNQAHEPVSRSTGWHRSLTWPLRLSSLFVSMTSSLISVFNENLSKLWAIWNFCNLFSY